MISDLVDGIPCTEKNVSDKEQGDVERAADHSAIRFPWFDGKESQKGVTKAIGAYDLGNEVKVSQAYRSDVTGALPKGAYTLDPAFQYQVYENFVIS
jgi:hypothetical protein